MPDLPAAAAVRIEPELAGRPLAVVSESGPRATVLSTSPEAARAGVHRGSALAHARAVCAALRVRVASPACERTARAALLDVALSVSPRVEMTPPRSGVRAGETVLHLDASGLCGRDGAAGIFPSEAGLAGALVARARAVGLPASAAVAGSRAVAELAARRTEAGATRVIPPGEEPAFLAPLPVDLLDLDDALAETLTRFGIHRLGTVLALPRTALATRLDTAVFAPLRGESREPPIPAPSAPCIEESIDLELPLESLEPLAFVLGSLLARLLARLAVRHLACGELELRLDLAPLPETTAPPSGRFSSGGGRDLRRLHLAAPTQDPRTWLRRLRAALEREPPRAAVAGCAIAAEGCPVRGDQLDLFRPAGPAPAELDALLAELEALCGPGRVGTPRPLDEHRPDAFDVAPFEPTRSSADPGARGGFPSCSLAVRVLRPPRPARVRLRAGLPAWIGSAVASGEVVHCAGPWRTTGGWWSEERRFACDAFDVAIAHGVVVRLRHDRLRGTWHVDALYD